MKKKIMAALAVISLLGVTPNAKAWFGSAEKERRIATEQKLVQEERKSTGWEIVSFLLATVLGLVFIVGTAIGSKGRNDANKHLS